MHYNYVIVLHELSHMWFGNLVTAKWWDDLWLQEAFANMISYHAMEKMATSSKDPCKDLVPSIADNLFIDEFFSGLRADQKSTTHSISCECTSTADAEDIFDGISYGKGGSFLR